MESNDMAAKVEQWDACLRIGPYRRWRSARRGGPPGGVPLILLRQWLSERRALRAGACFRSDDNAHAMAAYERMEGSLFAGINARQAWANWQVIPKTLHGRAPNRPLRAVDLACGDGESSAVLAHHLHPESTVIGLEYAAGLVRRGQGRRYLHHSGRRAQVHILHASILEPWPDDSGTIADGSVDWVNCCGALAHHFTPEQCRAVADECRRVLRPGAWAAVDARNIAHDDPVCAAFIGAGLRLHGGERSCPADRTWQACFRKDA